MTPNICELFWRFSQWARVFLWWKSCFVLQGLCVNQTALLHQRRGPENHARTESLSLWTQEKWTSRVFSCGSSELLFVSITCRIIGPLHTEPYSVKGANDSRANLAVLYWTNSCKIQIKHLLSVDPHHGLSLLWLVDDWQLLSLASILDFVLTGSKTLMRKLRLFVPVRNINQTPQTLTH